MKTFETDFLTDYSNEALLEELRRIANLIPAEARLTKSAYDANFPKTSYSTIQRRFGGWKQALELAGLVHLYHGQPVSQKMRSQTTKGLSKDDLINELKRVHALMGTEPLTAKNFNRHSITSDAVIRHHFGTFREGLDAAAIPRPPWKTRTFTDRECFENIADLWAHYGRSPHFREMFQPPSRIQAKTYIDRWGTWRKAKKAFVDWANADDTIQEAQREPYDRNGQDFTRITTASRQTEADCREVRPGLRFKVFQRDLFRCVACGRSPATHLNIELHADHILAVANGGKTTLENLQTLCHECNLGKGHT